MKKIFYLAFLGLLLSCGKGGEAGEVAIAFSQNPLLVGAEAGVNDCGLICEGAWTASTKDAWVTVLTAEGKAGDPLKIRVTANNNAAERNATVTVKAGASGKVLQLVQAGNEGSGLVSESKVTLDTYGTATYISVRSEETWSFTAPDAPWLRLEKKGPQALGIEADVNYSGVSRSASFTVTGGATSAEVTVVQQFSNERFLASTEYGRRLVYAMGSYIKNVTADSYERMTDGVERFEMSCTLTDGLGGDTAPRRRNIFLFAVDMDKATVLATLPDDDDSKIQSRQLMTRQLPALQTNRPSLTVWGGTNGDFFVASDDGETGTLQGVLHRRGKCLRSEFYGTVNTVYAVMKDGSARCMNQSEYNQAKTDIQEAIGGRQALLRGGSTVSFSDGTQHPRTAVGTSADGKKTWILVVDGRDELYGTGSFSVSYEVLARILKGAGASDAINLDGGGSSTFVVRTSSGSFSRRNQPGNAGRLERSVMDGLAVVTVK